MATVMDPPLVDQSEGPEEKTAYRPPRPPRPYRRGLSRGQWYVFTWVVIAVIVCVAAVFIVDRLTNIFPKFGKLVQPKETVITSQTIWGPIVKEGRLEVAHRTYAAHVDSNVNYGVIPAWLASSNAHLDASGKALFFVDLKGITFDAVQVSANGQSVTIHVPQVPRASPGDVFVTGSKNYDGGCGFVQSGLDHLLGDMWDCHGASEDQLRSVAHDMFSRIAARDQRTVVAGEQQLRRVLASLLEKSARAAGVTVPFTLTVVFPGDQTVPANP